MKILLTGGAGYIGSHTLFLLLQAGYDVLVLDNFSNSSVKSLRRVSELTGRAPDFIRIDLREISDLRSAFRDYRFDAVIHFAGLKAVGESVYLPLNYYENNVVGTLNLLRIMSESNVKNFVFSSSATVYGDPQSLPIKEDSVRSATNPYGRSKLFMEDILEDLFVSDSEWRIARLRYFNPVGAHPSGLIGEDSRGIPNNLMPYISQVAIGRRDFLSVYGDDYPTPDGTGVRDYIHVMDLAEGHLYALDYLFLREQGEMLTANLGTGQGYSVLEMIQSFEKCSGRTVPYKIVERRQGDIASCYADPTLAYQLLGWRAKRGIDEMCADTWRWQSQNPSGYEEVSV
jgi:UDP-glucose 4-epimerase